MLLVALLQLDYSHCIQVGGGQQTSLHGSVPCVGFREEDARNADSIPRLAGPCESSPQVDNNASGGRPLRYLHGRIVLACSCLVPLLVLQLVYLKWGTLEATMQTVS